MINRILSMVGNAIVALIALLIFVIVVMGSAAYFMAGPFLIITAVLVVICLMRGGNVSSLIKELCKCFVLACWQAVILLIAGTVMLYAWGSLGSILFEAMLWKGMFLVAIMNLVTAGLLALAFIGTLYLVYIWCTGEYSIISRLYNATKS